MTALLLALDVMIGATMPLGAHAAWLADTVTIGVMNDQNGPYRDLQGQGSIVAVNMAVKDFGGTVGGHPIRVIVGDHQNKPDVGTVIARGWYDVNKVGAIVDVPQSAVALGVAGIAREKNRVALLSAANLDRLTGDACSPNQVQWAMTNYELAAATANANAGPDAKTWFLIVVDLATGHDLQAVLTKMIEAKGGTVVGAVRHPLDASDFSSYLLQAQSSHANVIALVNATSDFVNAMKQATEYHIGAATNQRLIGITVFEPDIMALGLPAAKGTRLTMPFYWNINDGTRAFAARFADNFNGKKPTVFQGAAYSATLHYLKAVAAAGGDADGAAVVRAMKTIPVEDPVFGKGYVRADGLNVHPMYTLQVKDPSESSGPWDLYKVVASVPGDLAVRPLAETGCPLLAQMDVK